MSLLRSRAVVLARRFRLRSRAEALAHRVASRLGYRLTRLGASHPIPADCDEETRALIARVRPYTLTTPERIMALCNAVAYVHRAGVPGSIVECGVWRGGSVMAAALMLIRLNDLDRSIHMYDTFEYMPDPDERDVRRSGEPYADTFDMAVAQQNPIFGTCHSSMSGNCSKGRATRRGGSTSSIEETIPAQAPERIAICRLDTDWYRSTVHELEHLYPRIEPGGVLIIDDYGDFMGAKRAVDEYIERHGITAPLHRVDQSCPAYSSSTEPRTPTYQARS